MERARDVVEASGAEAGGEGRLSPQAARRGASRLRLALVGAAAVLQVAALQGGGAPLAESAVWTVAGGWVATIVAAAIAMIPSTAGPGAPDAIGRIGRDVRRRERLGEVGLFVLLSLLLALGVATLRAGGIPGPSFLLGSTLAAAWAAMYDLPPWVRQGARDGTVNARGPGAFSVVRGDGSTHRMPGRLPERRMASRRRELAAAGLRLVRGTEPSRVKPPAREAPAAPAAPPSVG